LGGGLVSAPQKFEDITSSALLRKVDLLDKKAWPDSDW
jgi:hypothetical protein